METRECEYCGRVMPKDQMTYYEAAGIYACPDCAEEHLTTCDRCNDVVSYEDSYNTAYGRLCECCHDDLFG